nr:FecR family protein [Chryseosolibacter indicus]
MEVITDKETETDTLPDGSNVFLNRETKLAYSFNKKENTHNVKLNGEAYFNIKHKNDEKFIIEVDGVFIKDIGTAFNVKAYPDSKTIEVVVEEGEVMFYSPKDSGVYLRANGKGVYNKVTKEFTIENPEPNAISYKSKFFIFSDTELVTVTETLNSVYNKKIFVNGALKKCHLTVTFNNESIDEIAHVIAETLGATVTVSGDSILLEGSGCGD